MKAKELMVGDYVMFDDSPCIIEEISAKGWIHILDAVNKTRVALTSDYILGIIEPIPLTPEILEKNGLEKIDEDVYKIAGDLFVLTYDFLYSLCNSFDIGYGNEYNLVTTIKYVHQLQHALRLLEIEQEIIL